MKKLGKKREVCATPPIPALSGMIFKCNSRSNHVMSWIGCSIDQKHQQAEDRT